MKNYTINNGVTLHQINKYREFLVGKSGARQKLPEILKMRLNNISLEKIANTFNLSRERIRQIECVGIEIIKQGGGWKEKYVPNNTLIKRLDYFDELSTRTLNALFHNNIRTLGGLSNNSKSDLLKMEGISKKAIIEIKFLLKKYKLKLK